ncbi:glycerol-3-phosphate dehydrogenase [Catenovulum sediminis]|uniref:Glycerol-3-phosphate dehydrogenase n=1 Tax=Catenovulum sediminis TaxID=1740262 RepID=A0ABV1REW5_9ALTE
MDKQQEECDVLVIGGGINGVGIANDAAGRGLKVLLCEQNDLASATSSASSKLIHGGLRYLEHCEFALVRSALQEREILLQNAPHIISPLRFILPHQSHLRPAWLIRLGLFLYDHLSKRKNFNGSRYIKFDQDSPLANEITAGFEYSDAWVDDARLVVLNAMAARQKGAQIFTQTRCIEARRITDKNGWQVKLQSNSKTNLVTTVKCKTIVNAAGPWVESLFTGVFPLNAPSHIRLVKGSHIVVPKIHDDPQAYILQNADKRIVFVIPYLKNYSLIGTTDIDFQGDPANVSIESAESEYLVNVCNTYFKHKIHVSDIVHSYSGVRPLVDGQNKHAQSASRGYSLFLQNIGSQNIGSQNIDQDHQNVAPLLSVYGGKITTYRKLAQKAVDKLKPYLSAAVAASQTLHENLPGGDFSCKQQLTAELNRRYDWLPKPLIERFVSSYGTLSFKILNGKLSISDLGLQFSDYFYQAEVDYLIAHEWAKTLDDILWRRTKLGLQITHIEKQKLADYIRSKDI